jgi:translocator protein
MLHSRRRRYALRTSDPAIRSRVRHVDSVVASEREARDEQGASMDRDLRRQLVTVGAYALTVGINGAAVAIPLGGMTTGEISDMFPVPVVPASYVFSIWSVIYLLLLGFTVYQALPRHRSDPVLRRLGYLPALTGISNAAWVLLWQYRVFALTVPVMLVLLVTLIVIYLRLREPRDVTAPAGRGWLVVLPFSVYLGWITVATIANVTQMLYWAGFRGEPLDASVWAVAILVVGLVIAAAIVLRSADVAYGLVIVWAYLGIVVNQAALPLVALVAGLSAAAVAVLAARVVARSLERGAAAA